MSLHTLASQLAAKGRNGDSQLVHMSPDEVAGLQALAQKHGTSLTTNPETGLPEAFSLKSLLPSLLGAGLSFIPGVGPLMAAGIVGGGTALATGSLQKGLMAGLGAYGGAGLGQGLAGMGTTAAASSAAAPAAQAATSSAMPAAAAAPVETALASSAQPALSGIGETAFASTPEMMAAPVGETVSQGFQGLAGSMTPTVEMPAALGPEFAKYEAGPLTQLAHAMGGNKKLLMNGLMAMAPGMIPETPDVQDDGGMIRPYTYDPTTQRYTAHKPYRAPKYADGGGITGLLQGPGDGVSDSIPALVNGQAPAALSNDEHVIPARVVSELGNGSSDAGHKRLDEMINRVNKRRAVTARSRDAVGNDSGAHRMLPA